MQGTVFRAQCKEGSVHRRAFRELCAQRTGRQWWWPKETVDLPEASMIDILEVRELSNVLAAVIEYRPKHPEMLTIFFKNA